MIGLKGITIIAALSAGLTFFPEKTVSVFLQYEHGFIDWPFDQLKAGVKVSLKIL